MFAILVYLRISHQSDLEHQIASPRIARVDVVAVVVYHEVPSLQCLRLRSVRSWGSVFGCVFFGVKKNRGFLLPLKKQQISGQIGIIPKPELLGYFGDDSLNWNQHLGWPTGRLVAIICPLGGWTVDILSWNIYPNPLGGSGCTVISLAHIISAGLLNQQQNQPGYSRK